ncbi:hypothetical protein HAX54_052050 [Datura stramonium]|uniref:Uncharacterized protein n=1 Tax=Datura stramonium TaxID=4076 RepID=A0ABS8WQ76_DATST|nr:hypothetical protein [Datura stramonium]
MDFLLLRERGDGWCPVITDRGINHRICSSGFLTAIAGAAKSSYNPGQYRCSKRPNPVSRQEAPLVLTYKAITVTLERGGTRLSQLHTKLRIMEQLLHKKPRVTEPYLYCKCAPEMYARQCACALALCRTKSFCVPVFVSCLSCAAMKVVSCPMAQCHDMPASMIQ